MLIILFLCKNIKAENTQAAWRLGHWTKKKYAKQKAEVYCMINWSENNLQLIEMELQKFSTSRGLALKIYFGGKNMCI